MELVHARKLLDIQIENARRILGAQFGVNHAEAIFFDIIRLLREDVLLKPYFLEKVEKSFAMPFIEDWNPGAVPRELIELVAHELRWTELLELANKRIQDRFKGDAAFAAGDIASRISLAFRDDWEDRDFYRHYGG
jgi:hypothetical protein